MAKKKSKKKVKVEEESVKVQSGQLVNVHYVGTFEDGTEFDSSREREESISVQVGSGNLIAGFDAALHGMTVGEVKKITLEPSEAYGEVDPQFVQKVPLQSFPPDFDFQEGAMVQGQNPDGNSVTARIDSVGDDSVVLNFNHPLAGKKLNFEIELLSVEDQVSGQGE
tara:strand:+ start:2522 stop:3022 length:501 start_codon:yes stop_codon:yes gene_type:complete